MRVAGMPKKHKLLPFICRFDPTHNGNAHFTSTPSRITRPDPSYKFFFSNFGGGRYRNMLHVKKSACTWANLFRATTISKNDVFPAKPLPVEGRNCERLGGKRLFYFIYSLILQSNNFMPTLVLCILGLQLMYFFTFQSI